MIPTKTAVAYCRYSSDRQHESSIEAQQAAIEAYASRHGINIVEYYIDRALSGTSDKRPEFMRLLDDLKTNPSRKVELVLVHKHDRFARNRYHAAVYSRLIEERGARLVAVAQDFGSGPEAVIMESLMQGWAEYYSLNLSSEVIKGRKVNIKKGRHPGGMYPFGYQSDGAGGYAIVEVEAYYIRRLYAAAVTGRETFKQILGEMQEAGVLGRRGRPLTPGNISSMLKKPIYIGVYEQRAGDESIRIENHHPAIVSTEIYKEAMQMIESRANAGRSPQREYLLTGLVRCTCGQPMYGHTTHRGAKTYSSYVCYKSCGCRSIQTTELDRIACEYVQKILAPNVRGQLVAALTEYIEGQRREAMRGTPDRRREIARLNEQINALTANLAAGVLPPSVVERIGKQITECETQIEVLSALSVSPPQFDPHAVEEYFTDACAISQDMEPTEAQRILRRFIERIIVTPTAIELTCTFDAWLRDHFPELASPRYPFPPQGPDNPKGGKRRRKPVSSPSSEKSDAAPAPSCTPSVSNTPTPDSRSSSTTSA